MTTQATATTATPSSTPATQSTSEASPQAATGTPQPTAAQVARMMKLKVDGQDLELPESEVIALAQQGKSAGKKFQEAAQARREAEQMVEFLKNNPREAFQKLGIDVRKFSEDTLMEIIEQESMSPEQKKAFDNEQKLKKYEADEKAKKDKDESDRLAELEQKHLKSYDEMFVKALSESGLPRTPFTIKRMAQLTLVNVKNKLDLEPSQLAKIVREDYIAEQKALFSNADGDTLLDLLGKDNVKKLGKAQLSKYKASKASSSPNQKQTPPSKPKDHDPISAWKQMQKKTRSML